MYVNRRIKRDKKREKTYKQKKEKKKKNFFLYRFVRTGNCR